MPTLVWFASLSQCGYAIGQSIEASFYRSSTKMEMSGSRLRISDVNGVTRVEFLDRNILDEANIQQIGEEIGEVVDAQTQPKILISFANVDHLSSAALGTLITINNKIRAKDGQLRLAEIDPQIYEIFVITKLNNLFQIFEDSQSAMASFS